MIILLLIFLPPNPQSGGVGVTQLCQQMTDAALVLCSFSAISTEETLRNDVIFNGCV